MIFKEKAQNGIWGRGDIPDIFLGGGGGGKQTVDAGTKPT